LLQSIVGPPLTTGPTDLKSPLDKNADKDFKGSGSESTFGKALEQKVSKPPKKTSETSNGERSEKRSADDQNEVADSKEAPPPRQGKPEEVGKKKWQRQQAIKEFMDSFEGEFQIPPTRLVEAMAKLDDQQLAQPPEETAKVVIDQLGLSQDDAERAQALYAGLLVQLKQIAVVPAKVPEGTLMMGAFNMQNIQHRAAAQQERQVTLNASVDRLTQKFWQSPGELSQHMEATELADDEITQSLQQPMNAQKAISELPPHLQGQMKEVASPALLAALAAQKMQAANENAQEEVMVEGDSNNLKNEFQKASEAPALPVQGLSANAIKPVAASSFAEGLSKIESSATELKDSLSGLESASVAQVKPEALKGDVLMGAPAPLATPTHQAPTEAEQQAAVQQVLKQAQFLVKKGGGEMNVQMTPEGLGTVHLKVMLQDGKVNLQMSADTHEAKKTIESSLAELKTSLAAQKLSMDNVRVDVVGQTSTDTATQNQTQSNNHGQRDQTRQFWNQFNENFGSQGRRESFSEVPNLRSYGVKRDPLQPIETTSQARSSRKVEGKGSGLNLVA
jgi:flagellar hook-length control protein FliK